MLEGREIGTEESSKAIKCNEVRVQEPGRSPFSIAKLRSECFPASAGGSLTSGSCRFLPSLRKKQQIHHG